ncbi:MAG: SDR family oxidoreductase [Armatimonadota bacterium]
MSYVEDLFSVKGKVTLFTGGAGILAGAVSKGLGKAGAKIVLTDITSLDSRIEEYRKEGIDAYGYHMDVLDRASIEETAARIKSEVGAVDILINTAGGNRPDATTSPDRSFFDLSMDAVQNVVLLNLMGGAVMPSQVFAKDMIENENGGVIINFSSMTALKPLTRVLGYSAAKAAVSNFTQWLAVHIAQEYSPKVRVNAIAPGFFLTNQNRYLLTTEEGCLTARGNSVIAQTPMGRFGDPDDLIGAILWLASPASAFVTGAVIPIDGGFSAFAGV